MKTLIKKFKEHNEKKAIFYREAKAEIAKRNLLTLRTISLIVTFMILFLITITPLLVKTWRITIQYILFAPVTAAFAIIAIIAISENVKSPGLITGLCVIFEIVTFGFIMAIDIFPYPDSACTFTPLALVVSAALFIFPFQMEIPLLTIIEGVFIMLTMNNKHLFIAENDVFTSLVGYFVAIILYGFFTRIHLQYYLVREQYVKVSQRDELTGVLNHIIAEERMRSYMREKPDTENVAVIFIDLDYFKKVNDTLGKLASDKLLKDVGTLLKDVFEEKSIIGRASGDEFCILFKNIQSDVEVSDMCTLFREKLEKNTVGKYDIQITCSIGAARTAGKYYSFDDLRLMAKDALYVAKNFGRNRCVYRNPEEINITDMKNRCIVVAHKDEEIRKDIISKFSDDTECLEAKNGNDAIELISLHGNRIGAVILDMDFEDLNGLDILHFMKTRIYIKKIPVLCIAQGEKEGDKAILYGADDVVYSPLDATNVKLKVDQIMQRNARIGEKVD